MVVAAESGQVCALLSGTTGRFLLGKPSRVIGVTRFQESKAFQVFLLECHCLEKM